MKNASLRILKPNAAGIDIGSTKHFVAVPADRSEQPVRSFDTFTCDLHEIAQWLKKCNIDTVAMESTGVYWIQLYLILESYGFEVFLVNARSIKNVTGRKSDVLDCQWIQELHSYGLLQASFQPDLESRELRTFMRHRRSLTESSAKEIQHMQKAFEQMNIKLQSVIADICGKTGELIIRAIIAGERNPEKFLVYVDPRIKASKEILVKSLTGNWRNDSLFELKQAYELYLVFKEKIAECDQMIQQALLNIQTRKGQQGESSSQTKRHTRTKNRLGFNGTSFLKTITGVDLTQIYGINELTAIEIISETGTDMSKWKTKQHFTSWLNLAPNTAISGGKPVKSKKGKKRNKAGQTFMIAASTLKQSENCLGLFYRRMRAKRGPQIAIKATARKIACIFYDMLSQVKEFKPIDLDDYLMHFNNLRIRYMEKQATLLGYKLTPLTNVS